MDDCQNLNPPAVLTALEKDTEVIGFGMASDRKTGSLLRVLAASKPGGRFLELGTGTGISAAWILDGMDQNSTLVTVDSNESNVAVARRHLGQDPRITFCVMPGLQFLSEATNNQYDFLFADTWPGKYDHLDEAIQLLKPGGFYVVDDMLPQPSWPSDHAPKVPGLIAALEQRSDFVVVKLNWSTGLIVATKR
jgi:predicted O-methyltransferase YrrM